ncbi:MAG TPA: iron-containing alcohol dehydrogenase [Spirochaetota bacterium]|nr:iron-containing alcohol dehydrogenase [Spirochaetota bacterium]HOL57785.1 iron-containing alcohol dehydrogenase [Spirochaetota bacterium]HPP05403.1 iron-containing alcohol dehydrogenase [Spirochaetota bacterium]
MKGVLDFHIPAHVKFGVDVVNRIGNVISEIDIGNKNHRPIIVTESVLYESGVIKRIKNILSNSGYDPVIFDEVVLNAASDVVDDGAKRAKVAHSTVVIGLGGVRTLSIAKAIAMLANNEGEISDYIDGKIPSNPSLPYIEIPSTPRNPFMFRDEFWLTDARNRKSVILKVKKNTTRFVLFDPSITTTLTRRLTATTSVEAFANSFEGYISTEANYLSDTLFIKSMELFANNIFNAANNPNDITARANLGLAGFLSSLGLSMTSTGITAALSYVLSSKYKIHKSLSAAIILPHVMDYNITATPAKYVKIAEALGEDVSGLSVVESAIKAIEKVRRIIIELQLPTRLEEFDITKDDLITVANEARGFEMLNFLPRSCDVEELYQILQAAY